ncbi:hypothetical protein PHMEG_00033061, partial [Phytophthora megakarya]
HVIGDSQIIIRQLDTSSNLTPSAQTTSLMQLNDQRRKRAENEIIIGIDLKKKTYRVFIPQTKHVMSTTHIRNIDRLDSRAVGRYMDTVDADNSNSENEMNRQQGTSNSPSSKNNSDYQAGSPSKQHQLSSRAIQRSFRSEP